MNWSPVALILLSAAANMAQTPAASPSPAAAESGWTPTILVGLIGSLLTAITAITVAVIQSKKAKETETLRQQGEKSAKEAVKSLEDSMVDREGFKEGHVSFYSEITDMDGSCIMHWEREAVEITKPGSSRPNIPLMTEFMPPAAKIMPGYPKLLSHRFEQRSYRDINLRLLPGSTDKVSAFTIDIPGALKAEDGPLSYSYEIRAYAGFYMTREEVDQAFPTFKREYISFEVVAPIDKLELEIKFPEKYPVTVLSYGVFMGPVMADGLMSDDELRRIEPGFTRNQSVARLEIDNPRVGHRYLIYWQPPAKTLVDALKAEEVK
ncbi:MAG TPA: hypothetical protein VEZ40_06775 [Pyrinomonadaceae bacterium]|nr:hypothetical protein [Pyrinomonadaceae bacterium]